MVPAEARNSKGIFRSQAHPWESFGFKRTASFRSQALNWESFSIQKGQQALEAKPFIGKALDWKGQQALEAKQVLL